jgi:predicted GIY-YIG superfamily endonuclease
MEIPLIVGPMERGREWLSSKVPVKRPDFTKISAPRCPSCGTILSDDITETMEVRGVDYCPVCILEDVHPFADPFELSEILSQDQLRSEIVDRFDTPPEQAQSENAPMPGSYILWCPPKQDRAAEYLSIAEKFGNLFTTILAAATGNGLLYVGQSNDVAKRVWNHSRGGAASVTRIMKPNRLVSVNWKSPDMSLRTLENQVGQQVARSVEKHGYDLEVYWD